MGNLLQSEFITVNLAPETTRGTQAAAAWWQTEPNPGGVQGFYAQIKMVARKPVSKAMMTRFGEKVGLDSTPKLAADLTVDVLNQLGASMYRTTTKFPGGTGTGRWTGSVGYGGRVTAVTSGSPASYTVDVGGALVAGVIVYGEGFTNAANNGIHVLAAGSTATSIKTNDVLVTEVPPLNARLWVVGYQAAVSDFAINVTGAVVTLTSAANVLASLGIQQYAPIWVGGGTALAPGLLGFTTAANRGSTIVSNVAAGALTLTRATTTFVTEAAGVKTIQIFFGPWFRNVQNDNADWVLPSHTAELVLPKLGAGPVDDFVYATGAAIGIAEIDAGLEGLITLTLGLVAMSCSDPTVTRATGAATALAPLGVAPFQTADGIKRGRVTKTDGTVVLGSDIQSWKLSINNNVKPYKAQGGDGSGGPGARDLISGDFEPTLTVNASLTQDDLWKAIRAQTPLQWDELVRNGAGAGLFLDMPYAQPSGGDPSFPANDVAGFPVTLTGTQDPVSGMALAMTLFPFLPAT